MLLNITANLTLNIHKRYNVYKLIYGKTIRQNREFAKFVEKIVPACPAVRNDWSHIRMFKRQKYLYLNKNKKYDAHMRLTDNTRF